jgi:predicted dehydrogenase
LTHDIHEADVLLQAARRYGVVTQMGNQGKSSNGVRRVCEWIWGGAIGQVKEVHMWTDRFKSHVDRLWIQGVGEPLPEEPIPDTMAWDLWLGVAPTRPYNHGYAPFAWRGWWDFGCGALGDMGCHIMNAAFWSLDLALPSAVECIHQKGKNNQTGPSEAIVQYDYPARYNRYAKQSMGPVKAFWYESGLLPDRPEGVPANERLGDGTNGTMFIGEKGILACGSHGNDPRLLPASEMESRKEELGKIPETLERIPNSTDGHYRDFARACKNGGRSNGDFEYSVPLTKMVLLGNVAMRVGEKIEWDGQAMRALNNVNAGPYLSRDYREGYSLAL